MEEPTLQDDNIEAKVSQEIIDNLSTDIASKYDEKLASVEEKSYSNYVWLTFSLCLISLLIVYSSVGTYLQERVVTFLEFRARAFFDRNVQMSPQLKILAKDDTALAYMGKPNLSIEQWADFLEFLARHKPASIYIDKIFSVSGVNKNNEAEVNSFSNAIARIEAIEVPIYVGTSINPGKIPLRSNLEMLDAIHELSYYGNGIYDKNTYDFIANVPKEFVYSRHPDYGEAFQSASIAYFSERYVKPMYTVDSSKILPHMGLLPSESIEVRDNQIYTNNKPINISDGKILINYLSFNTLLSQTKSIRGILQRIDVGRRKNKQYSFAKFLKPGDHIFVIPEFFTGSTDFKKTPWGDVFGGIVPASLMNSVLMNEWLREIDSPLIMIAYLVMTGVVISFLIPLYGWAVLICANIALISGGLYSFSYFGLAIPWFFCSIFSFLLGALIMVLKSRTEKIRQAIVDEMKIETEMISKENLLFEENQKVLLQEKREAASIAAAFSPDPIPNWEEVKITGHHKCFDAASGDWFFFEKSNDGKYLHAIMCDITGHGVQAALIVSTCKTVLNTLKNNNPDAINKKDFPLTYLKMLNRILYTQGKTYHVTTFAGVTIEPESNELHFVTCAHPPPLLHKHGEPLEKPKLLRMRNDPVGYMPDVTAELETIEFNKGDKVVINTDGIPITENFRFYKAFLKQFPNDWSDRPLELYNFLWEKIKKKTGKDPDDDVSVMIYERR